MGIYRSLRSLVGHLLYQERFGVAAAAYLQRFYTRQLARGWYRANPPEWFDHRIDLYTWRLSRSSFWVERGVFSRQVLFPDCSVLDVGCGDGFYSYHFFSPIARKVDAFDRSPDAIDHARRWHGAPNIRYFVQDAVTDPFPGTHYDAVIWDGAIDLISLEEAKTVLAKCAAVLQPTNGVLAGYSPLNTGHQNRKQTIASSECVRRLLAEFFPVVQTFETEYRERQNLYFRASNEGAKLRGG